MNIFVALQPIVILRSFIISIILTTIIYFIVQQISTNLLIWRIEDLICCYDQLIKLYMHQNSTDEELKEIFKDNNTLDYSNILSRLKSGRQTAINLLEHKWFLIQSLPDLKDALITSIDNDFVYIDKHLNPFLKNYDTIQQDINKLKDLQNMIRNS